MHICMCRCTHAYYKLVPKAHTADLHLGYFLLLLGRFTSNTFFRIHSTGVLIFVKRYYVPRTMLRAGVNTIDKPETLLLCLFAFLTTKARDWDIFTVLGWSLIFIPTELSENLGERQILATVALLSSWHLDPRRSLH